MVRKMQWPLLSAKWAFSKEKMPRWLLFNVAACRLLARSQKRCSMLHLVPVSQTPDMRRQRVHVLWRGTGQLR